MPANVPALISISITDLLVSPSWNTRAQKSSRLVKGPFFARACRIASIGARPTFLIASSPKRTAAAPAAPPPDSPEPAAWWWTVKSNDDAFTHGGRTGTPIRPHSSIVATIFSVLSI
jgi:hypothetical protein